MALNRTEALLAARMASAAYWPDEETLNYLHSEGFRDTLQFDIDHSQAYVCRHGDDAYAVFRGSDDLVDWYRNLKFLGSREYDPEVPEFGRVHRGFNDAWLPMQEQINAYLDKLIGRRRKAFVFGHSQGAAVGIQAVLDNFALRAHRLKAAYWFGCPRTGNSIFGRTYNRLFRQTVTIRNGSDIVALSPPWNSRVGRQYQILGTGSVVSDPPLWFRAGAMIAGAARWYLTRQHFALKTHFMHNYEKALETAA